MSSLRCSSSSSSLGLTLAFNWFAMFCRYSSRKHFTRSYSNLKITIQQWTFLPLYLLSPVTNLLILPIFLKRALVGSRSPSKEIASSVLSTGYSGFQTWVVLGVWTALQTDCSIFWAGLYRLQQMVNLLPLGLGITAEQYWLKWSQSLQFFFLNIISIILRSFQMFENSLIGRLNLRCPEHPKYNLSHICVDPRCDGWPLFCEECKSSYRYKERHYGHELSVLQLPKGIQQLCNRLDRQKRAAGSIYREMVGLKGVQGLLKWQEEKQQHFNSIENHINTIKFQVEEEISNIVLKFQQQLTKEKTKLYNELESYYKNYRQKFDKFSRLTEPIVAMQSKFKFYASPHTLFFKISSESGQSKLGIWLSDLKKTLSLTEKATHMPAEYTEQIKRYGQLANEIMDDLPRIRNVDYEREMPTVICSAAHDVLRALVKLKDQRTGYLNRSNSMQMPSDNVHWKHSVSFK